MKFADQLRAARMKAGSVLHQFLLELKRNSKFVHAFFEGYEDESFYLNFISAMLPPGYELRAYRCGTKTEVYEAYRKINSRVKNPGQALFFVDKDYSDYLGEAWPTAANIFVTLHYSIENYLVTESVIRRALRELFQMTDSEKALGLLLKRFERVHKRFCQLMIPLTAIIIALRYQKAKVNLNNLQLGNIFEMTLTRIARKRGINDTHKVLLERELAVSSPPGMLKHASHYKSIILKHEPKAFIRGKYEVWMLATYLNLVCTELKLKNSANLHKGSVIQILGPRLAMPEDIRAFLTNNLSALP
jgi:hypothetical protein